MLRDPTKRAISQYFHFKVSSAKEDPTDANFQKYFMVGQKEKLWNYYLKDLSMNQTLIGSYFKYEPTSKLPASYQRRTTAMIQDILMRYDFIAITERMDESLVVMKFLLNLDFEDILYASMKTHGSFTPGGTSCVYIVPSFLTKGMKEFFNSTWLHPTIMGGDIQLYNAAVKSLDNTIEYLGKDLVEKEVAKFRAALKRVSNRCIPQDRCNSKGEMSKPKENGCYLWDVGCSYGCINEVNVSDVVR